jgi:hypothetical protein
MSAANSRQHIPGRVRSKQSARASLFQDCQQSEGANYKRRSNPRARKSYSKIWRSTLPVSDLYRGAVFSALEAGDIDKATALIKTWAWVTAHAVRSLDLVCKIQKGNKGKALDYEQVLEREKQKHDTD